MANATSPLGRPPKNVTSLRLRSPAKRSAPAEPLGQNHVRVVVDEGALHGWLGRDAKPAGVDVSLCLKLLDILFHVVDASLFVIADDGEIVVSNPRGRALLESDHDRVRPFLEIGTAIGFTNDNAEEPSSPAIGDAIGEAPGLATLFTSVAIPPLLPPATGAELATWSMGSLRAWRRWFSMDGRSYALVMVERSPLEETLERGVTTWQLTTRQRDVLRMVLGGSPNKEISRTLKMALRTVEVHISALLEKAGADTRARLIAKTWELGRPGRLRP